MKVILAGGGTGGHLFCGIAIAEGILERVSDAEVIFICTDKRFDIAQLRHRFSYIAIPISPPGLDPAFPARFCSAISLTHRAIRKVRPDIVVGLGGYGSIPAIIVAVSLGIPYVLVEQNVLPGRANRLSALFAKRVYLCRASSAGFFHNGVALYCGCPLRRSVGKIDKGVAREVLGLKRDIFTLVVLGGSQGAGFLNHYMIKEAPILARRKIGLQIVHLSGYKDLDLLKDTYSLYLLPHVVVPFSEQMGHIYSAADLILSRAGGVAVAEIASYGLPAIFVPYDRARDKHQHYNVREFADDQAAMVYTEAQFRQSELTQIIQEFMCAPQRFLMMGQRIAKYSVPEAREKIVNDIIGIISGR
jgi:UDP-N-acetylglucosamine--N-acetylmuramyl-(pentapeptide) pyrophosphoryl-undecaprenol N-acetylglucosamine transferase